MTEKTLNKLSNLVKKRIKEMPKDSYVSKLASKGKVKIANKLGEESVETISAFLAQERTEVIEESADLIFHLIILLEFSGASIDDVLRTLQKRMKSD